MTLNNIDCILVMQSLITEDANIETDISYGNQLLSALKGTLNKNWAVQVSDFGKQLYVSLTYHNHVNGISSSQSFLIVYNTKNEGIIKTSSVRKRTISSISDAVSYIKMRTSTIRTKTMSV